MSKKPETIFRNNKVRPALEKIPHSFWESIQQISIVGTPDIIGCVNGLFVAIEIKTDTGKRSAMQAYKMDRIEKDALGIALVIQPSNLEESISYLNSLATGGKNGKRVTAKKRTRAHNDELSNAKLRSV